MEYIIPHNSNFIKTSLITELLWAEQSVFKMRFVKISFEKFQYHSIMVIIMSLSE